MFCSLSNVSVTPQVAVREGDGAGFSSFYSGAGSNRRSRLEFTLYREQCFYVMKEES